MHTDAGAATTDELLTSREAADEINRRGIPMTEGRLRQLRSAGRGPVYRKKNPAIPQSDVRYLREDVDAWIQAQHPANWPAVEPTP